MKKIGIIMGSDSDLPVVEKAGKGKNTQFPLEHLERNAGLLTP